AELGADAARADRRTHQSDPELAIRNRTFRAIAESADAAWAGTRQEFRPARRKRRDPHELCTATARSFGAARTAVRTGGVGRGAAGQESAHAGASRAAFDFFQAPRVHDRHAAGKSPGRAVVASGSRGTRLAR